MRLHTPLFDEQGDGGGGGGGAATTLLSSASQSQQQQQSASTESGGAAYDFRSSLDDNGAFKADWTNGLPDSLKDSAGILSKYRTPVEALGGLVNAQKLIGQRQGIQPPAPDAKPEDIAKYNSSIRAALGMPDKLDDYKIALPEKLPEGITVDDAKLKEFSQMAHSLNIPAPAAQKLIEYQLKQQQEAIAAGQAKIDGYYAAQKSELQKEWGESMQTNAAQAITAAEKIGIDPNDPEIGNSAKMIKVLFKVSQLMKPDTLRGTENASTGLTGEQAAEDIRNNPNNPLHAAYHGKLGAEAQKNAVASMNRLRGQR